MKHICLLATVACLLVTACNTPTQSGWSARVGNYTYDQAMHEFGAPKTDATTADGSRIAEWLTRQGSPRPPEFGLTGMHNTPGPAETAIPHNYPDIPSRFLRLTFGPDGKLTAYKWISRTDY